MRLTGFLLSLLAFAIVRCQSLPLNGQSTHRSSSRPSPGHPGTINLRYNKALKDFDDLNITVAGKRNFPMSIWNYTIFCNGSLPIFLNWCFKQVSISAKPVGTSCYEANLTSANKIDQVHRFQAAGTYQMFIIASNDASMSSSLLHLHAAPPGPETTRCSCNFGWLLAIFVLVGGSMIFGFSLLQILRYQRSRKHQVETADFDFTPTQSSAENSSSSSSFRSSSFRSSREKLSCWWERYNFTSSALPWKAKYKRWMSSSSSSSSSGSEYGTFVEMKETKPV